MVLLASGIVSKQNGKILVSRQFVEMTRSRIEGLLTAFTKLVTKDKQHTFVETDSVRYVYQALMDHLYCVLITTKTSNILEDLETLRLFVRVIGEYTSAPTKSGSDEQSVLDNAFTLIFAFDEIVALGYRESVNMSQVRTFIEMDSHEERVYVAVRETQEKEAKQTMREKAKELSKLQRTQQLSGGGRSGGNMGGSSIDRSVGISAVKEEPDIGDRAYGPPPISTSSSKASSRPVGSSRALKLGSKSAQGLFSSKEKEQQLASELKEETPRSASAAAATDSDEPVHVSIEEKLKCELSRDGGSLRTCELSGIVNILIRQEAYGRVKIGIESEDENVQIQTHPNIDKDLFKQSGLIGLRQKSFPIASDVGVLKYRRIDASGSDWPPLTINAWPNGSNCNLELQVNRPLKDISVVIPCPSHPVVNECTEGDYEWKKNMLTWRLSFLSMDSPSATIDFDLNGSVSNDDFFPINCAFQSETNLAGLKVTGVSLEEQQDEDIKWSANTKLSVDKYQIC